MEKSSRLSEDGRSEILRLAGVWFGGHTRYGVLKQHIEGYDFGWDVSAPHKASLRTRIMKQILQAGVVTSAKELKDLKIAEQLGQTIARYTIPEIYYDFTDNIDWVDGDFGDHKSCLLSHGILSQQCKWKNFHVGALRFWAPVKKMPEDYKYVHNYGNYIGIGRMWVAQGVIHQERGMRRIPNVVLAWNGYGSGRDSNSYSIILQDILSELFPVFRWERIEITMDNSLSFIVPNSTEQEFVHLRQHGEDHYTNQGHAYAFIPRPPKEEEEFYLHPYHKDPIDTVLSLTTYNPTGEWNKEDFLFEDTTNFKARCRECRKIFDSQLAYRGTCPTCTVPCEVCTTLIDIKSAREQQGLCGDCWGLFYAPCRECKKAVYVPDARTLYEIAPGLNMVEVSMICEACATRFLICPRCGRTWKATNEYAPKGMRAVGCLGCIWRMEKKAYPLFRGVLACERRIP